MDRQVHPLLQHFVDRPDSTGNTHSITVTAQQFRSILRNHGTTKQRQQVRQRNGVIGSHLINIGDGIIINVIVRDDHNHARPIHPPARQGIGIYIPTVGKRIKRPDDVYLTMRANAGRMPSVILGPWLKNQPNIIAATHAFGITQPPAIVLVRSWIQERSRLLGAPELIERITQTCQFEPFVVINDADSFADIPRLLHHMNQLSLIFHQATADQIKRSIRRYRSRSQVDHLFHSLGSTLGSLSVSFSAERLMLKIRYHEGKVQSAEISEADKAEAKP
ncbi:hypothetical protein HGA91_05840 [candidate division WWE3 bacterium]|nr:hypothetical protein [candidate division WWE3 bacterium]